MHRDYSGGPDPVHSKCVAVETNFSYGIRVLIVKSRETDSLLKYSVSSPENQYTCPALFPANKGFTDQNYAGAVEAKVSNYLKDKLERVEYYRIEGTGTRKILRNPRRKQKKTNDRISSKIATQVSDRSQVCGNASFRGDCHNAVFLESARKVLL